MIGIAEDLVRWLFTQDRDKVFEIKEHKEKRSDNANKLLWDCLGDIAVALRADKWEREYKAAKEYGAVFLMQVGGALRSGKPHDGRAPDYDDWNLNGDILLYDPLLDISLEVSSMGIRVDPEALRRQLKIRGCEERAELPFQKALLNGELPQTIGGGIGQSRMCVYFLRKAHVGEVQASLWPEEVQKACKNANIPLL